VFDDNVYVLCGDGDMHWQASLAKQPSLARTPKLHLFLFFLVLDLRQTITHHERTKPASALPQDDAPVQGLWLKHSRTSPHAND